MRSTRTILLKIGAWLAFGPALLPVLVALSHLMPVMAVELAPERQPQPAHHAYHQHPAIDGDVAEANSVAHTAGTEDCHPPGLPCDTAPRDKGMHCPLCLWLQGLHALPAPIGPALRVPSARVIMVQRHDTPAGHFFVQSTSQPRAPPLSPAA